MAVSQAGRSTVDLPRVPVLPGSLNGNRRLSQWLAIHPDGTVLIRSGKVEFGQGIGTALAQIAAEELDVALSRIRLVPASTATGPNEGLTAGSLSVQDSGSALRQVCAEARAIYLKAAAMRLNLPRDKLATLEVVDGSIRARGDHSGPATSYWALADDALLECEAGGQVAPKGVAAHQVVGRAVQRLDIPDKVTGQPRFIHDMTLPGMLYGRVAHPPSTGAVLIEVDLAAVQALPGVVATVRDGRFLGVIADSEYLAVRALNKLAAVAHWREAGALPDMHDLPAFLRSQPVETTQVADKKPDTEPPVAAHSFHAAYSRPFLAHASIGPSCAVARYHPASLEVWTHSQGIYNLRADLALTLALPADTITVQHVEGAGCYGHNGADDVACDAALLARAVPGRPVQVQWTREDELGCSPFGAAMAVELKADVGVDGRISDWQHEVWSTGHSMRPGRSKVPVLLAATLLEKPFELQIAVNTPLATGGGSERNAVPLYDFAQWRVVSHRTLTMPIRTSSLRSLGAHCNIFAIESFLDEIAARLGVDPLEFRLRHLVDPRARAVLEAAAQMAGWSTRTSAEGRGMGLAVAQYKNSGAYCAVVASIDAGQEVRVDRLWIAVDVGLAVNPDGVINQIEGGAIQTVSWVLKEAVQFDRTRILSTSWESYPIVRFSEVPEVQVQIINRPDCKSVGAGEATHGPVAAAIANAVADALGVRVRSMPLTAEAITRAALADEA
ncbi:MAG: oxidoreductase [Burkholderiales bacterium RIFCSPHIGHO2_12_FULL_61_11]|nr:MAG: oxidoreductase [Burkholderiales bacterium RIFCSPHIGHO2_12_FULL_61_11]